MSPMHPVDHPPEKCVLRAWQAHEKELLDFLRRRVRESHAAEDLLQDVFLKSIRQGSGFCLLDNPRAWLFRVARNALVDASRGARDVAELPADLVDTSSKDGREPVEELDACLERNLLQPEFSD